MRYTVRVTAMDIKRGMPRKPAACPVALALSRIRNMPRNSIMVGYTYLTKDGIPTPRKVANFIARFDADKPVKPFSFRVSIPTTRRRRCRT